MKTKTININWNDVKSIKDAERQKTRLENAGYSLKNSTGGLFYSTLTYQK